MQEVIVRSAGLHLRHIAAHGDPFDLGLLPEAEARRRLTDHLRVCLDSCHLAVMYESPETALERYAKAGIGIGKAQISAAMEVFFPEEGEARRKLRDRLWPFPLFDFWGPKTSIRSSRWIADAAIWCDLKYDPMPTLIYLPHLDYNLQRLGPRHPAIRNDLTEIDAVCDDLIRHYEAQMAHVYVNDPARSGKVRRILEKSAGIASVWGADEKKEHRPHHPRSGDLIALSDADAWFTYYYWLDDRKAPDFARTVDIHRKPGYDPVELFIDPALSFPRFKSA